MARQLQGYALYGERGDQWGENDLSRHTRKQRRGTLLVPSLRLSVWRRRGRSGDRRSTPGAAPERTPSTWHPAGMRSGVSTSSPSPSSERMSRRRSGGWASIFRALLQTEWVTLGHFSVGHL